MPWVFVPAQCLDAVLRVLRDDAPEGVDAAAYRGGLEVCKPFPEEADGVAALEVWDWPHFRSAMHYIGKLCPQKHVYPFQGGPDGAPGSLRYRAGTDCVICKAQRRKVGRVPKETRRPRS